MQRPILYLLTFCILLGIAIIGSTQWSTPTPPPATAAPPTATSQPAATSTAASPPALTTDHIALPPFTITLAAPWPVLRPSDGEWAGRLQAIAATQPMLTHYVAALAAVPRETTIALTWPAAATTDLQIVAAVIPADGLTLQGYLAAVKEEFAQSRLLLGAAVTIKSAALRYDLRQDHVPVATLHYTQAARPGANPADAPSTGYQAVMIDKTGKHLLLLTAVTHDVVPTNALALFDALVATIQEE